MSLESAKFGFPYDSPGISYFEVFKDGSIDPISHSRGSIEGKKEHSLYQAYFRASRGECTICFSYADSNGNVSLCQADDLEALADSVGIIRPTNHVHEYRWEFNEKDPGKGRYALIDIEFLCGCKISCFNIRIMAKQLRELEGWEVKLSGVDSKHVSKKTIEVLRNSIRTKA